MTEHLAYVTLDVFTSTPYTGNPLAIIKVPSTIVLSLDQKQRIAREFNFSESVFLHEQTQQDRDDESVRINIFTTEAEVPFAGHPTVGTANYLLRLLQNDPLNGVNALQTKAGRVGITLNKAVFGVQVSLAHNVHIHNASPSFANNQTSGSGQQASHPRFGHYPVVSIVKGMTFILVQLPDLETLESQSRSLVGAEGTYTAKDALDEDWREGLVATYFYVDLGTATGPPHSDDDDDDDNQDKDVVKVSRNLRTRCFATREDPATGSAASALTSYLSLQQGKPGRYQYVLTQGVEMGQKSEIFVEVALKARESAAKGPGDPGSGVEVDKVLLSGSAVQVMQGTLQVPGV